MRGTFRSIRNAVLGFGVCALVVGCSSSGVGTLSTGGSGAITEPAQSVVPVIDSFVAEPAAVVAGGTTTLTWSINDPNARVSLTPFNGTVTGTSVTVSPVTTTTFSLTVMNAAGTDAASVTVVVSDSAIPGSSAPIEGANGTWVEASGNLTGMKSECGNLARVYGKPDEDFVIANVALHGLWATLGASGTWSPMGQDPGSAVITNRTGNILFDPDPAHSRTFWESGIYHGGGVYRTDNDGASFTQLGNISHIDTVSVDFTDPNRQTLLAGMHEAPTLYLSRNGGTTWDDISAKLPADIGYASAPFVLSHDEFLLGTYNGPAAGIYHSTDGGATWQQVFSGGVMGQLLVHNGAIFWIVENGSAMIKSTDGGLTWAQTGQGPSSANSRSILDLGDGRIAALGGDSIVISADEGATWTKYGPPLTYADAQGIAYAPARKTFYAWRAECGDGIDLSIKADSIIRLDAN